MLVRQHGLIDRVPVHHLGFAIGNAFFQHFEKQPLVPLVVTFIAGGKLAAPVNCQTQGLHLLLHVRNVAARPFSRRHTVFQRRVFSRQAKRIPAHRHQHVVALHPQAARQHVVDRVVAHMAHVQLAAGVGQHRASVELAFGLVADFAHAIRIGGIPGSLRLRFNGGGVVAGGGGSCERRSGLLLE